MSKYYATRNFKLGRFAGAESVPVSVGAEISFDGKKAQIGEMEDFLPSFEALVKKGWVSTSRPIQNDLAKTTPSDVGSTPKIRSAKTNSRTSIKTEQDFVDVSKAPITKGIHKEAKEPPKKLRVVSDGDDHLVVATNISTKGIPKREDSAKPKEPVDLVEPQDGETITKSLFKTKTKTSPLVDN